MNYNYLKLKDTWDCKVVEGYEDPIVSMSLPEWNQYVAEGKNVMFPAIKSSGRCPYCKKVGGCSCGIPASGASGARGPNPFGCACGGGGRMIF